MFSGLGLLLGFMLGRLFDIVDMKEKRGRRCLAAQIYLGNRTRAYCYYAMRSRLPFLCFAGFIFRKKKSGNSSVCLISRHTKVCFYPETHETQIIVIRYALDSNLRV